ncbi:hypothetical protein ACH5BF_07165 [Arcobacter sp. YIC-464]
MKNINETNLYKKNIELQNNMLKVYSASLVLIGIGLLFKGVL